MTTIEAHPDSHDGHVEKHPRLAELEQLVRDGRIDTIVVALTDMQGRLMGKRVQGQAFLDGVIDHGAHFCTYLLGTDMEMNTPDGFRLMNWETGYGDWIASPIWDSMRIVPWLEKHRHRAQRHDRRGDARGDPGQPADHPQAPGGAAPQPGPDPEGGLRVRVLCPQGVVGAVVAERLRRRRSGSATTTRTTTCSRPPRPSRSIACCATR